MDVPKVEVSIIVEELGRVVELDEKIHYNGAQVPKINYFPKGILSDQFLSSAPSYFPANINGKAIFLLVVEIKVQADRLGYFSFSSHGSTPWQFGISQAGARSQLQEVLYKLPFTLFVMPIFASGDYFARGLTNGLSASRAGGSLTTSHFRPSVISAAH